MSLALAGSLLGFLVYNFPPAKIFMGDSGSLFIGFTLASLAIANQKQQASDVLAVLGVPTLLFLLPILDTALVTFTRLMRGQSPVQGGRDHTSHRLIAFGLNERQTLFVLYGVALASAVLAAALEIDQLLAQPGACPAFDPFTGAACRLPRWLEGRQPTCHSPPPGTRRLPAG